MKLAQWFWRRRFLNFVNVFSLFRNYLRLEKGGPFIWTNLNPLYLKMVCAKVGWYWHSGSGEVDFSNSLIYLHYFVIISHWKRAGSFIWTNLNPLYLRMISAKFGWNWPTGSREGDFFLFVNVFLLFCNNLPFEKGGALHLKKLESPLSKDALC